MPKSGKVFSVHNLLWYLSKELIDKILKSLCRFSPLKRNDFGENRVFSLSVLKTATPGDRSMRCQNISEDLKKGEKKRPERSRKGCDILL